MNDNLEVSKRLASLAVFRKLYDNKKGIYEVISLFVKEVIVTLAKHVFNLTEITHELSKSYDFDIPEAVVKTSLRRLSRNGDIEKKDGQYLVNESCFLNKNDFERVYNEKQQNNNLVINNLFNYIEKEQEKLLTDFERRRIMDSFCSFMLDDVVRDSYHKFISFFIIKNSNDPSFISNLNMIKEGVVLYSGFKYNNGLSDVGNWEEELIVFLDTEIIFNFSGYNGELFKSLFDDFILLVKEINKNKLKKKISLRYFSDTKHEIDSFFYNAEQINRGKNKLDPSKQAMSAILEGCHSPSDILEKKNKLYWFLDDNGIKEDDYKNYYDEDMYAVNIEDQSLIDDTKSSKDIIKHLNYVNICRKGECVYNLKTARFIFLTGKREAWELADKLKNEKALPLAVSLDFVIDDFWFKLNKGFGVNSLPRNFNIITKAQVLLSYELNLVVAKEYEELKIRNAKGEFTKEETMGIIAELRSKARLPEAIISDDVCNVLASINEDDIEKYLRDKEFHKNKTLKAESEISDLKQEILLKKQKEKDHEKTKIELEKYKEKEKMEQEKINTNIEKKGKRKIFLKKSALTFALIIISFIFYDFINRIMGVLGWIGVAPIWNEKLRNLIFKKASKK